ncbi:MAG: glycoside hydrolase family 97 protein [Muribaculaceae bacterium]|nr:glycoside hydrolase family 97 protein [Muribaculaceae bacterium]
MKINQLLTVAAAAFITACNSNVTEVKSPDGTIKFNLENNEAGLSYTVSDSESIVVSPSRLGFVLADGETLDKFDIKATTTSSHDEKWETTWGESRFVRNNYNQLTVEMQQHGGDLLVNLEVRVFDDGFGYRYVFPKQQRDSLVIMEELTEFKLPVESQAWAMSAENAYLEGYFNKSSLAELDTIRTPVTIELPGKYLAIHEAALTDFPKMNLMRTDDVTLRSQLVPWSNGVAAYVTTPFATPWRFMIIGDEPGDLVTSYLMLNLNEPCAIADPSFCKPMKYLGVWWEMHLFKTYWYKCDRHGANTANVKKYIDFAAEHGIPGVLVEGWNKGWEGHWPANEHFSFTDPYDDYDIEELSRYATEKGVELIMHHETGAWTKNYEAQLDTAYQYMNDHNIHNVKTGYVNLLMDGKEDHSSQYGVRHYRKVIETAAKYTSNIDNHEPVMPTGLQRTYPNLMTQEGVRGQEHSAWDEDGGNPPYHTVVMPFTRGLAGPMDFTFGTFNFDNPNSPHARVQTTLAKELALYVIIYSPMQMASDLPENYAAHLDAFQFIKDVPVDWDVTVVPAAVIGDYVAIARKDRNSTDWYLGVATDEEARNVDVSLDFLDADAEYTAQIYADAPDADWHTNPTAYVITEQTVTAEDILPVKLAAGGGTAVRFIKK